MTSLPAPGWYPDPPDPRMLRWWDGRTWSPYVVWAPAPAPVAVPAVDAPQPPHPPQPPQPQWLPPKRTTPPLDDTVAALRTKSPQPWGWRPVGVPLLTLVGVIIAGIVLSAAFDPSGGAAQLSLALGYLVGGNALMGLGVWWGGRAVAARSGGWGEAFGLRKPRRRDLGYAGVGIAVIYLGELVVTTIANALTAGKAGEEAQNLDIDSISTLGIVLLVLAVVIWAPLVEETMFRGLLLRTFMQRMRFWWAALLSSAIFGLLHTYEVSTLAGALTLAAGVGTLALVNCYLNRLTDSLVPGMIVHASFNCLAVIVTVVQAKS